MLKDFKEAQKAVGFYHYREDEDRPKGDFYATPDVAVEKLLGTVKFGETILEPCCGNGVVSTILENHGYKVTSRDLYDWGYGEPGVDFLDCPIDNFDAIITNPPFKHSLEFAQRSLEFTKEKKGKVALLNRIQWLEGQKRREFFENSPLSQVLVFSKRIPRLNRFDFVGKSSTSILCFAWYLWDWTYKGDPKLGWL